MDAFSGTSVYILRFAPIDVGTYMIILFGLPQDLGSLRKSDANSTAMEDLVIVLALDVSLAVHAL